jgi:hypothetical protein
MPKTGRKNTNGPFVSDITRNPGWRYVLLPTDRTAAGRAQWREEVLIMNSSVTLAAVLVSVSLVWAQDAQKAPAPAQASTAAKQEKSESPAELKTQAYKGTLVDASCAGAAATPAGGQAGAADRSTAAGQSQGCTLSSSTKEFALRTKDGQTLRFDSVGNDRAEEALRNKKKWSDSISAGKPIQVKVQGAMTGDKLTVITIG